MEIRATLQKPYTEEERENFIVEYNHNQGYLIEETASELQALGYTDNEVNKLQKERIAMLSLTRGDVFRGILLSKGVTKTQIRNLIEAMPEETQEEILQKELALIDFDDALNFYRGNSLIDVIGAQLGITSEQLDKFFETNDYTCLTTVINETEE